MNIPFVNALAQILNYVKFMKDIMSNENKLGCLWNYQFIKEL